MLDADGDGVGRREEFLPFMRKLRDMDGRIDRLPTPESSGQASLEPPTPKKHSKKKQKRKGRKAKDAKPEGHDEL